MAWGYSLAEVKLNISGYTVYSLVGIYMYSGLLHRFKMQPGFAIPSYGKRFPCDNLR